MIRWIANSEAYNLTSRYSDKMKPKEDKPAETEPVNAIDNPAAGETPLFSHMYVKSMEAEQLYDSLIIATDAHKTGRSNWDSAQRQRDQWMQQFVIAFGTDENDETTTFNGTIPQALMMMDGPLIQNAVSSKKGSYLHTVLSRRGTDADYIRKLFIATLEYRARQ